MAVEYALKPLPFCLRPVSHGDNVISFTARKAFSAHMHNSDVLDIPVALSSSRYHEIQSYMPWIRIFAEIGSARSVTLQTHAAQACSFVDSDSFAMEVARPWSWYDALRLTVIAMRSLLTACFLDPDTKHAETCSVRTPASWTLGRLLYVSCMHCIAILPLQTF